MKVLMIVTKLNIGGTETYVLSLAQALRAQGVQVGIATSGGPLVATCHRLGILVHMIPSSTLNTPTAYAHALSTVIKNRSYQIVHAHDPRSFRAIQSLRRVFAIPVVITLHGTYFHKALVKSVALHSSSVISVSPALSKWAQSCGVAAPHIKVIPNGIATSQFTPVTSTTAARKTLQLPQQGTIIAYAGRFSSDKQWIAQKIIQAGERINRLNPSVITVLAGPGTYRAHLVTLAAQANQRLGRKAIYVRPPITNIRTLYHAANIVVGTGRVALEAMSCGKPVLAAGVKGYLGLVTPQLSTKAINSHFGDHAFGNKLTVDALVRDLNRVRNKPELTQSLSKFGRQLVVQRFSISQVANRVKSVYEDCLHSNGLEIKSSLHAESQPTHWAGTASPHR